MSEKVKVISVCNTDGGPIKVYGNKIHSFVSRRSDDIGDAVASIVDDLKLGDSITLTFKLEEMDAEEYEEIVSNGD